MSIRMDRENFEFLSALTKEERTDLSKTVRDLVTRGRVLLAVEKYRDGEASLGKASELAGLSIGQMMAVLADFASKAGSRRKTIFKGCGILPRFGEKQKDFPAHGPELKLVP
jgi:predicted HTH domain antitoxin